MTEQELKLVKTITLEGDEGFNLLAVDKKGIIYLKEQFFQMLFYYVKVSPEGKILESISEYKDPEDYNGKSGENPAIKSFTPKDSFTSERVTLQLNSNPNLILKEDIINQQKTTYTPLQKDSEEMAIFNKILKDKLNKIKIVYGKTPEKIVAQATINPNTSIIITRTEIPYRVKDEYAKPDLAGRRFPDNSLFLSKIQLAKVKNKKIINLKTLKIIVGFPTHLLYAQDKIYLGLEGRNIRKDTIEIYELKLNKN